jgi:hypothetical protein
MRLKLEQAHSDRTLPITWPRHRIHLYARWLVLSFFILSLTVQAQVMRVNLREMVEAAGTIVTGQVVDVREGRHPNYPNVAVTYITVEVEDMLKGAPNRQTQHVFMQFGGLGATRMREVPSYRVGEEVVLFLYPESEYGFTSPVGGDQGKFYVRTDPQTGQKVLGNSLKNARLFEGIDTNKLSLAERNAVRSDGTSVDYQAFASLVRRLVKK